MFYTQQKPLVLMLRRKAQGISRLQYVMRAVYIEVEYIALQQMWLVEHMGELV